MAATGSFCRRETQPTERIGPIVETAQGERNAATRSTPASDICLSSNIDTISKHDGGAGTSQSEGLLRCHRTPPRNRSRPISSAARCIRASRSRLAAVGETIGFGFVFGFGYGAIPAFYTEIFPTRYRVPGASAGYQIAQVYGGGLIPIVAGLILKAYGIHQAYLYIGGLVMAYAVLAIFAVLTTPEIRNVDLEGIMTPAEARAAQ